MKERYMRTGIFLLVLILVFTCLPSLSCGGTVEAAEMLINEIMYDPFGSDTGNEWIELYHRGSSSTNGWTISNRNGTAVAVLPDWDIPDHCYLVIYFGNGTDDSDFSDGNGSFYTGSAIDILDNTEDEVALYSDNPCTSAIVDFVSWCADGTYDPGPAHDFAVNKRIWTTGEYLDTSIPTEQSLLGGRPIGRDKNSTDANRSADWNIDGGVDSYYATPGVCNTGPRHTVDDGIKLTQFRANLVLTHWDYQVTNAGHTILEEYQTDDETYVKANHYFEANLNGIVFDDITGIGEYHWYKANSSTWKEETSFLLTIPDTMEGFSMNYTNELVRGNNNITINEHVYATYTAESTMNQSADVLDEILTSNASTTITQTGVNSYHTEIVQQTGDRGVIWDVSFIKDELRSSETELEAYTTLNITNNVEEPHSITTHYSTSYGEEWGRGAIGEINVSYQDYSVVYGDKTYTLDGPGYLRVVKTDDSRMDILTDLHIKNVYDPSESLDLGSSAYMEILTVGEELAVHGYVEGNMTHKVCQYYIDGAPGAVAGGAACGAIGQAVTYTSWWSRLAGPKGFIISVGLQAAIWAVCGGAGVAIEQVDKEPPAIIFTCITKDSNEWNGYNFIRVRITDDSSLSKIRIIVQGPGGERSDLTWPGKLSSPWQYVVELYNFECEWDTAEITVYATDDALLKNRAINRYPAEIPPRLCEAPTEVPPDGSSPTPTPTQTPEAATPTPTSTWTPPSGNQVQGVEASHWLNIGGDSITVAVNVMEGEEYEHWLDPPGIEGLEFYHESGFRLQQIQLSSAVGYSPVEVPMSLQGYPFPDTVWVILYTPTGGVFGYIKSIPE